MAALAVIVATDCPQRLAASGDMHMLAGRGQAARLRRRSALIGAFDPGTEVAALAAIAENAS